MQTIQVEVARISIRICNQISLLNSNKDYELNFSLIPVVCISECFKVLGGFSDDGCSKHGLIFWSMLEV